MAVGLPRPRHLGAGLKLQPAAAVLLLLALALWLYGGVALALATGVEAWAMLEGRMQSLLHVLLALLLLGLIRPRLGVTAVAAAALSGVAAHRLGLFEDHAVALFQALPPLVALLGSVSGEINPQYPKLLALIGACLALGLLLALRVQARSLDRVFLLLIGLSALGTLFLFHRVVVQGALAHAVEQNQTLLVALGRSTDPAGLGASCALLAVLCRVHPLGTVPEMADLPQESRPALEYLSRTLSEGPDPAEIHCGTSLPTTRLGPDSLGQRRALVVVCRQGGQLVSLVDLARPTASWFLHIQLFSMLCLAAHTVWLVGGLSLLSFHRLRFSRRSSQAQMALS